MWLPGVSYATIILNPHHLLFRLNPDWFYLSVTGLPSSEWGAGVVVCLERVADLHMAQLMPLPLTVSCFSKIQIGFTFLLLAHPGSPGKEAVKRVCVCVTGLPRFSQKRGR